MNPKTSRLTGLVAAPFTPMLPNGSLKLPMVEQQAKFLAENRVSGAFVCGTTGEGMSLTTDERLQVAKKWVEASPPSLRVIVHVGHHSVAESRAFAAHAEKLKAHAVATLGPTFFPIDNVEQLVNYCSEIASAAPTLPFYYYHMPAITGVDLPMYDFLKIASRRIPNLAGVKFTHENLMDYSRCLAFEESRFNILFGRDEILLATLALGGSGAVGSTYNYIPGVYHRIIDAFNSGDMENARRFQRLSVETIAIMLKHGGLSAGKAMMKLIGLDCGPVRAPLQNLTDDTFQSLTRELEQIGFPSFVAPGKAGVSPGALAATAVK